MLRLYYNPSNMRVRLNNKDILDNYIFLCSACDYTLELLPTTIDMVLNAIYTTLKVTSRNEIITAIELIKYSDKEYYMLPNFAPYHINTCNEIILQRAYDEHRITVFKDALIHICIENDSNYLDIIVPFAPTKIIQQNIPQGVLFLCISTLSLQVILYDFNDYYCILDKLCDGYEFKENGIIFRKNCNDNQGRVHFEEYSFSDNAYVLANDSFEYTNPHTVVSEVLSVDFLQAIMNKDYIYAYNLLQNLDMTMDTMIALFGDKMQIVNVSTCVQDDYIAVLATRGDKQVYERFHFELASGKISRITKM